MDLIIRQIHCAPSLCTNFTYYYRGQATTDGTGPKFGRDGGSRICALQHRRIEDLKTVNLWCAPPFRFMASGNVAKEMG